MVRLHILAFLNHSYRNRWINRGGTQSGSPRSPELFHGDLKSLVYPVPIQTEEKLQNRIIVCCQTIRNPRNLCKCASVYRKKSRCLHTCRWRTLPTITVNNLGSIFCLCRGRTKQRITKYSRIKKKKTLNNLPNWCGMQQSMVASKKKKLYMK